MKVVIIMPAICRPSIIAATLKSFWDNCFREFQQEGGKLHLYINIDPVKAKNNTLPMHILKENIFDMCNSYAPTTAILPETANFSTAFISLWNSACFSKCDYVFLLEDDWILQRPINLFSMIRIMEQECQIATVRLPMFPAPEKGPMKNWNRLFPWIPEKQYYLCPAEAKTLAGMCGHPSLINKLFVVTTLPLLDTTKNPEKQFHAGILGRFAANWDYVVYSRPGEPPAVKDIGRPWIARSGLKKKGIPAFFTTYEEA